MSV
ncbi:hypothetical protein CFC21_049327, partial [Triticum aestivum]|jgi:hypothetical protein|eukprot:gene22529-29173_t